MVIWSILITESKVSLACIFTDQVAKHTIANWPVAQAFIGLPPRSHYLSCISYQPCDSLECKQHKMTSNQTIIQAISFLRKTKTSKYIVVKEKVHLNIFFLVKIIFYLFFFNSSTLCFNFLYFFCTTHIYSAFGYVISLNICQSVNMDRSLQSWYKCSFVSQPYQTQSAYRLSDLSGQGLSLVSVA